MNIIYFLKKNKIKKDQIRGRDTLINIGRTSGSESIVKFDHSMSHENYNISLMFQKYEPMQPMGF